MHGKKKLLGNYTRKLCAVLQKFWKQYPKKQQLYDHLSPILQNIQVRLTRHIGHCWRSWNELFSDVVLWTTTRGCANVGRPIRTSISSLWTLHAVLRTSRWWWTMLEDIYIYIERERESVKKSVLSERLGDDDNDDDMYNNYK